MTKVSSITGECEAEGNRELLQNKDIIDGLLEKSSG